MLENIGDCFLDISLHTQKFDFHNNNLGFHSLPFVLATLTKMMFVDSGDTTELIHHSS